MASEVLRTEIYAGVDKLFAGFAFLPNQAIKDVAVEAMQGYIDYKGSEEDKIKFLKTLLVELLQKLERLGVLTLRNQVVILSYLIDESLKQENSILQQRAALQARIDGLIIASSEKEEARSAENYVSKTYKDAKPKAETARPVSYLPLPVAQEPEKVDILVASLPPADAEVHASVLKDLMEIIGDFEKVDPELFSALKLTLSSRCSLGLLANTREGALYFVEKAIQEMDSLLANSSNESNDFARLAAVDKCFDALLSYLHDKFPKSSFTLGA